MTNFHEEVKNTKQARKLLNICVKEIETRTKLNIRNKPFIKVVESIEFNPYWYSAYKAKGNTIFVKKEAECTNIVHELIHANTDLSGGYDFSENFANYFTFLVTESLVKADRPVDESNIRDFLRGIGIVEKIRGVIGDELFALLVTDFYAGLNTILNEITRDKTGLLEMNILRFLISWSNLRHSTLELYEFTPEYIAKELKSAEHKVTKAIQKLKKLGLVERLDSFADSVLCDRLYKLCEQLAESKKKEMSFFYR